MVLLITTCQLYMRNFKDGDTIVVEPFRAKAFPVIKDLIVDRSAFDRIIGAGGYVSVNTGGAPDGNASQFQKNLRNLLLKQLNVSVVVLVLQYALMLLLFYLLVQKFLTLQDYLRVHPKEKKESLQWLNKWTKRDSAPVLIQKHVRLNARKPLVTT